MKKAKKRLVCAGLILLLTALLAVPALANSAQTRWTGTDAAGAIVMGEDCPIVVERELLRFDITEFPLEYYREVQDYLSYSASVTAEYTFYNPADYEVTATLLFPFGTLPDYGYLRDPDTDEMLLAQDSARYGVAVDGEPIDAALRHSLSFWGDQFELERDLARLHSGWMEDEFYAPDLPVSSYTYVPAGVDQETWNAAHAAFVLNADPSRTRVLMEGQSGGKKLDDGVAMGTWVDMDRPVVVHVIGESLAEMPEWKVYENGACELEIPGSMTLINSQETTLRDLVLREYDPTNGASESDWYNAVIESMKYFEWSNGAIGMDVDFDVSYQLMRWYEYEITLAPGERIVNTVTAPMYPSINAGYEPSVYTYNYLLSPAQTWSEFGELEIRVDTPFYLIESGLEGFEKTESGYALTLPGLPEGELNFSLSAEENPAAVVFTGSGGTMALILLAALIIVIVAVIVIVVLLVRRRKKSA